MRKDLLRMTFECSLRTTVNGARKDITQMTTGNKITEQKMCSDIHSSRRLKALVFWELWG